MTMPDVSLNGIEFVIKGSSDEASESVDKLTEKLNGLKSSLMGVREVSKFSVAVKSVGSAAKSASKPMNNFLASIKRIAFYRMIRTIIKEIADAIREGSENFYNFSKTLGSKLETFATAIDRTKQAASQMKNQIGSAFGELYQLIVPIIIDLINYVTQLAEWFSKLFAALRGAEGWWKATAGGISDVGGAAKEAMKYLAPFDELNRLPGNNGGGGGGGGGTSYEWMPFGEDSGWGKIAQFVRENLEALELLVDVFGFTIGVVSLLSGHFALGLGLMTYFGYKGIQAVSENWGSIKTQLQGTLGELTAIVSGASLVLGILLILAGAVPLGLGLVLAGAAGLTATVAANWEGIKDIGRQFVENIKLGIEEKIANIKEWIDEHILDPIRTAMENGGVNATGAGIGISLGLDFDVQTIQDIAEAWNKIKKGTKNLTLSLKGNLKEKVIDKIASAWDKIETKTVELIANIQEGIAERLSGVKTAWDGIKKGTKTLAAKLTGVKESTIKNIASSWEKIYTKGATLTANLVNNVSQSVMKWLTDAWASLGNVKATLTANLSASDVVKKFVEAWNKLGNKELEIKATLADKIKSAWNTMANAWNANSMLRALYTMPTLAKGGIVDTPTFIGNAIVGEAGKEAIVPLENNTEWIGMVASGLMTAISNATSSPSAESMENTLYNAFVRALNDTDDSRPIYIDGDPIYRSVVNRNRKETFRTGVNPMMSRA